MPKKYYTPRHHDPMDAAAIAAADLADAETAAPVGAALSSTTGEGL